MDGLTIGRMVHYVPMTAEHMDPLQDERPAVIVRVRNQETGCSNLQVFTDGSNDGETTGTVWVGSALFSETPTPGHWHWPERA